MKTIREAWDLYKEKIPSTASETQLRETKKAFYAGALGFTMVFHKDLGYDHWMALNEELCKFQQDVEAGRE